MDNKRKKVILSFVLIVMMISIQVPTAIRAEELDRPEDDVLIDPYETVHRSACYLSISSGTATVSAEVYGKNGTFYIFITVHLEKLVNGSWQPYCSWNHSGGTDVTSSDSINVTSGAYRVWTSVSASGTNGSDSFNVDGNVAGC